MSKQKILDEIPGQSKYVDVLNSTMHYAELGSGDPIVFVHGNPTYSFLWRKVMPYAAEAGRAIAVDLIGMGLSAKPVLAYTYGDQQRYFNAFMDKVAPGQFSLVLHDWGGPLGLTYALDHPDRVKRIILMETFVAPLDWSRFSLPNRVMFRLFRFRPTGFLLNQVLNVFVKVALPRMVRPDYMLPDRVQNAYELPYPTISSRRPVAMWPKELPFSPRDEAWSALVRIREELPDLAKPTLLLHGDPGLIITQDVLDEVLARLPRNTKVVNVGPGLHFLQEAQPDRIGQAVQPFLQGRG